MVRRGDRRSWGSTPHYLNATTIMVCTRATPTRPPHQPTCLPAHQPTSPSNHPASSHFISEAIEYRIAHSLNESKLLKSHEYLSSVHLVLSSFTSGVLFLSAVIGPSATLIGKVLSFSLTCLNSAIQGLALSSKAAEHTAARLAFAAIQRQFATQVSGI